MLSRNRTPRLLAIMFAVLALLASACSSNGGVLQGDVATDGATSPTDEAVAEEPDDEIATSQADPADNQLTEDQLTEDELTDDDSTDDDSTADQPTEAPDSGLTTVVSAFGGATDTYNDTRFTIQSVESTSSNISGYLRGEPTLDCCERNYVIVSVTVENLIQRYWSMSRTDLLLQSSTGEQFVASETYNEIQQRRTSISFDGRDATDRRIIFETESLLADLSGWHLIVRGLHIESDRLPLVLPLDGPAYARNYPLALADGAASEFASGTFSGCSESVTMTTLVERALVALDDAGQWDDGLARRQESIRVGPGDRLIAIDLAVTSQDGPDEFQDCGRDLFWPDFILEVDGFDVMAERANLQDVEASATSTSRLVFKIPASSQRIALLGGADRAVLASWNLSLPLETGEDGAALIPDRDRVASETEPAIASRPAELTTTSLTDGGSGGIVLGAQVVLRTTAATNAEPVSFINDRPEVDSQGKTWVIADVEVTGDERTIWQLWDHHFVLIAPNGRPHLGVDLYDQSGDDLVTANIDGAQRKLFRVVFETNGLVADSTGWTLAIQNGDDIPLELALNGTQPEDPRRALASGQAGTIGFDGRGCQQSVDAEITSAVFDVEGPRAGGLLGLNVARTDPDHRMVVIDLALANATSNSRVCSSLQYWPEFLLEVDGRMIAPLHYGFPQLDDAGALDLSLSYEIPRDSQSATFTYDGQAFASWQLKNATEVLSDLNADAIDDRTLITLDETLLFAFGESSIQQAALAPLSRIASVINSESAGDIEIVGHTDSIGQDDDNQALSLARAQAVADALAAAGVDEGRLVVSGLGETDPVAPNETEDGTDDPVGRAKNRRVEIFFTTQQ